MMSFNSSCLCWYSELTCNESSPVYHHFWYEGVHTLSSYLHWFLPLLTPPFVALNLLNIRDYLVLVPTPHLHKTRRCGCYSLDKVVRYTNCCRIRTPFGHVSLPICLCQKHSSLMRNILLRFYRSYLPSSPARCHNLRDFRIGLSR